MTARVFWLVERHVENDANLVVGVNRDGDLIYAENWRRAIQCSRKFDAERLMRHAMKDAMLFSRQKDVKGWLVAEHSIMEKSDVEHAANN